MTDIRRRLEALEREQVRTDERYMKILDKLEGVEKKVEELAGKPGKRWDAVVSTALQWLVIGLLGMLTVFK